MHRLSFTSAGSIAHHRDCDALGADGVTVPFAHAALTAQHAARPQDLWCAVRDATGAPVAGAVVRVERSRKLPWIRLARVEQAGRLLAAAHDILPDGIRGLLASLNASVPSLGRVTVQCYSPDAAELARQRLLVEQAGLSPTNAVGYTRSLRLPLTTDVGSLLARLTSSARRNVRALDGSGYHVRPLTDPSVSPRLAWLLAAAHERTGGRAGATDWAAMLHAAAADPTRSIVLGVIHPQRPPERAIVGFAQGTVTDGAVCYAVAGTERAPDIGRTPLSYALLWGLLEWAAARGHAWFDMGGVTPLDDHEHPLAGISAFKRRFGGEDCEIAHEWRAAPHAPSAALLSFSEAVLARM